MGMRPEPNVQCHVHVCKLYILFLHAFSFNCGCRSGLAGGTLKLMATPLPPWGSLLMWLSTRPEGQTPHWPRTWQKWLSKTRLQTMKALMVYLTCIVNYYRSIYLHLYVYFPASCQQYQQNVVLMSCMYCVYSLSSVQRLNDFHPVFIGKYSSVHIHVHTLCHIIMHDDLCQKLETMALYCSIKSANLKVFRPAPIPELHHNEADQFWWLTLYPYFRVRSEFHCSGILIMPWNMNANYLSVEPWCEGSHSREHRVKSS